MRVVGRCIENKPARSPVTGDYGAIVDGQIRESDCRRLSTADAPGNNQCYQTDLWWYHWHYPWYAYYNASHGPYANWMSGGGWATYGGNCGPQGCGYAGGGYGYGGGHVATGGVPVEATLTIALPADAKLSFNGVAATGTGATRSFRTPPLQKGQTYEYQLTAEVIRDGKTQTATEKVTVRGGEKASVTLSVEGVRTASK